MAKLMKLQYMHPISHGSVSWNARCASTTIRRHRREKISWSMVFARQPTEGMFTSSATLWIGSAPIAVKVSSYVVVTLLDQRV